MTTQNNEIITRMRKYTKKLPTEHIWRLINFLKWNNLNKPISWILSLKSIATLYLFRETLLEQNTRMIKISNLHKSLDVRSISMIVPFLLRENYSIINPRQVSNFADSVKGIIVCNIYSKYTGIWIWRTNFVSVLQTCFFNS